MQIRLEQLAAQLAKGLQGLYVLHGDEALLLQEAADAIRTAARASGCEERQVHTVAGANYDWSGLVGAARSLSLFAPRQLIEIRIPSGRPGKDGAEALQRYCASLGPEGEMVTIVSLPRLDRQQLASAWFGALDAAGVAVRIDTVERHALPQWIARRLAAQGQRVRGGDEGQQALAYFADQVEGNLLAAQQEIAKLALLHGEGELSFEQIEAAVGNVARFDVFKLGEAMLAGQVARTLRMLDALEAEGVAPVLVHYTLAGDILALKRVRDALAAGRPLPLALRENRVWGAKERLFERVLPQLSERAVAELVAAASVCDGLCKGLGHPKWPGEPWSGLQRLALMVCERVAAVPTRRPAAAGLRLALAP